MTRVLSVLLLCLLSVAAIASEQNHPVTMWRVAGEANFVYLLGSIHLLREEDHPLPGIIGTAYDDAEVVVMELDMDDLDPLYAQSAFNEAGVMTDGQTLRDLMGEDLYAQAEAAAEVIDIPLDMLARSEPWLAAMTAELMMPPPFVADKKIAGQRVTQMFQLAAFYDFGQVYTNDALPGDTNTETLAGAGAGVRVFYKDRFVFKYDFGVPVNKHDAKESVIHYFLCSMNFF